MNLDENQILETAQKIKSGILPIETLKVLLGGEKLDSIFSQETQLSIFNSIICTGKLHNKISDGNGLDILESLLNNNPNGNISDFFMIKPDYILQLPPEQQKNMANCISGGRQDLSLALLNLWSKGIRTEACTTKDSDNIPMIQFNIKENEIEKQDLIQRLYEQFDINGTAFYDYQAKDFCINLSGNNLYNYLQEGNIPLSKIQKSNIFEGAIRTSLQNAEELYSYYSQQGFDTTELSHEIESEKKSLEGIISRINNSPVQAPETQTQSQSQAQSQSQSQIDNEDMEL